MNPHATILCGDAIERLRTLADQSVRCCVTSPPYWGLRDYGVEGQLGLEKDPEEYVTKIQAVFKEVYRVLKNDGTLWLNVGDSYCATALGSWTATGTQAGILRRVSDRETNSRKVRRPRVPAVMKPKDLVGIPWMIAFSLRAQGWYLRSDIIWNKANCMPESVTDRPTRSHEYLFLLSKSERYFYDCEAIKEPASEGSLRRWDQNLELEQGSKRANGGTKTNGAMKAVGGPDKQRGHSRRHAGFNDRWDAMEKSEQCSGMRNKRDVWTIAPANFTEAHFATYPADLVKPCILAGSEPGDTIIDPFAGSGTTGMVAIELGRKAILIELNPQYIEIIKQRCNVTPGLALHGK